MSAYRHTQPGTLNRVILGVTIVLCTALAITLGQGDPTAAWVMLSVCGVLVLTLALFHALTVEVRNGAVRLRFGIGLIHKSFRLRDIEAAEPVRNRWWYGWGIRLTPHGWLFTVSGLDAVEIRLRNGRSYRIGSDEPERLARAIQEAIQWNR
jgi:hypothetical protein